MTQRDDGRDLPTPPPAGPVLVRRAMMVLTTLGPLACGDDKGDTGDSTSQAPMPNPTTDTNPTDASVSSTGDGTTTTAPMPNPTTGQSSEPPMPGPSTEPPMPGPTTDSDDTAGDTDATAGTTGDTGSTTAIPPMPPPMPDPSGDDTGTTAIPPMPNPSDP